MFHKKYKKLTLILYKFQVNFLHILYVSYSFLIAARGLNFMALKEGKKPATIPTKTANTSDTSASHGGI